MREYQARLPALHTSRMLMDTFASIEYVVCFMVGYRPMQSLAQVTGLVMIVEPDEVLAQQLAAALLYVGLDSRICTQPRTATLMARQVHPDLIVTARDMRGLDGMNLFLDLHHVGVTVPVILLTSTDTAVDAAIALRLGMADCLHKPLAMDELVARVQAVLRRTTTLPPPPTPDMEILKQRLRVLEGEQRELRHHVSRDPLSRLYNRPTFEDHLAREVARSRRQRHPLSVVVLDIDHFKVINDRAGRAIGDDALRRVATLLRQQFRGQDVPARMGGDEFAVMLPDTLASTAFIPADRLRQQVAALRMGKDLPMRISVGIAEFVTGDTGAELCHRADTAMYESKRQGGNRVTLAANPGTTGRPAAPVH